MIDFNHIKVGSIGGAISVAAGWIGGPVAFWFLTYGWLMWGLAWEQSNQEHRVIDPDTMKGRIYSKDLPLPPHKWDAEMWWDLVSYYIPLALSVLVYYGFIG